MDEKRGAFIVIEGSDGSGKATQLKLTRERLEAAGYAVETFDFPRYDQPSSYFVKRYLEGKYGTTDEVGPYTSSLFYALDRFEAAPAIRQALQDGKVVICNRYTGSNMAHQGTKIANAEQRRGFFIWLDNLEFEMLRIPRPDISFVLRVPTDISINLIAQRGSTDIHESDPSHLQRTLAVYDDMTQLFPKDFQRIDCVRGGRLLDIETVNAMLWEKINPLLPKATGAKPAAAKPLPAVEPPEITASDPAQSKDRQIIIENASGLLSQRIERLAADARVTRPDIPSIYLPTNLIPDAQEEYEAKTNTLLGLYAKLVAGLAKHGISAADARRNASLALPVAATTRIELDPGHPKLEELVVALINDPLPEARSAGASLFAQAIQINPSRFTGADKPLQRTAPQTVKALADEFLAENHIGEQPAVQLTSVWPRNESDLVADMLYEYSNLPLQTVRDRISTWPLSRKLAVYEAYVGDARPGAALEKPHYSWDLQCPYAVFRELQKFPAEALSIQPLTPRYGFDIPQLIEDADLADTFEKCFDLSVELYSALQKAGHQAEAQYATLFGHKQRWQMTQNAVQTISLQKAANLSNDAKSMLAQLQEKLAETHPVLAEVIA